MSFWISWSFSLGRLEQPSASPSSRINDATGAILIVEVEREATDAAIGQILRLSAGYEKSHGLPPDSVRSSIACFRINDNVVAAANRAKIEVWKLQDSSFTKISKSP